MAQGVKSTVLFVLLGATLVGILAVLAITIATVVKVYQTNGSPGNTEASTTSASTTPAVVHYTAGTVPPNSPLAVPYGQVSKLFLSMINISADPCNNFYEFTCGNYNNSAGMSFDVVDDHNMRVMAAKITDSAYRNSNLPKPVKQLFDYFEACKTALGNWASVTQDATYVKSKLQMFQNATQLSFPLLQQNSADPSMPNAKTLATAIGYLDGVFQISTFISSFIDTNWRDPQSTQGYMLFIDQATLTYPPSYYLKAWNLIKYGYKNRLMRWMNQLAPSLDQTKLSQDVTDMMNLEMTFVNDLMTDATTRRKYARSYNRYTRAQASKQAPFIDWYTYLKQLATFAPVDIQHKMLSDEFEFIIMEPSMLRKLNSYMTNGKFKARTIINYLNYRIVDMYGEYMPSVRGKIYEKVQFHKPGVGLPKPIRRRAPISMNDPSPLDTKCASLTVQDLEYANARVFIDAMYPTAQDRIAIRQSFGRLTESVIVGFRSMIDQLDWMSDASKKGAYNKIDKLVKNIAYPDFITDNAQLTQFYALLDIKNGDSFTTMKEKIRIFDMNKAYASLGYNQTRRDDFNGPPGTVNAWYQPELNSITFPAAILQQPFYDPKWPASVNYGGLGIVAGHELTHGFDDEGVQWDGTGVLYQWMDNSSFASFQNMANCVIKEYGAFCPLPSEYKPSNCLDGAQTQGENIADNGGIHAAYRAYKDYEYLNGPEPLLNDPIMSQFTHDQLFFMSFAQVWCEQPPSDSREHQQILMDPHSPSKYRVFGTIQNYPAFQSAFHCPLNTAYAPEKHCNVWVSPVEASYGMPKSKENSQLNVPPLEQVQPDQPAKFNAYLSAVQMFKESMNISANPCTNFYDYVCGNFHKLGTSFSITNLKNYQEMANQMELPKYSDSKTPLALKKTIKFYDACKKVYTKFDEEIKNGAVVLKAIKDFQKATGLKFSMVDDQMGKYSPDLNKETLAKALGTLSRNGIDTLVSPLVDTNWEAPQHYKFFLDQNTLYYSKTYYTQIAWKTIYASYKNNTINLFNHYATLLKKKLDQTQLAKDVDELLNLEKTLANSYSTDETARRQYKRSYNPYNISMAQKQFDFINFTIYFASLAGDFQELGKYFYNPQLMFLVMEPDQIKKLSASFIAKNFNASVVSNYFFYRILAANRRFLPRPSNYEPLEILSDEIPLGQPRKRSPHSMPMIITMNRPYTVEESRIQCASETVYKMQYANARFFIDFLYPDQASRDRIHTSVNKTIAAIKLSFRSMLNSLNWMDDKSKKGAYDKLNYLKQNIAYPPFITIDAALDKYYEDLVFADTDTYFDMISKLQVFNFKLDYKPLLNDAVVDRNDFLGAPGIVNAWYQPELNSITFPAGILQHPYFDENWPISINYGGLGLIAGHELTHGFDDEGVQWNGTGALEEWMTKGSESGFNRMAKCVVDEYNGFCPLEGTGKEPSCINGEQTQGENIADNGGIHAAWIGYQTHVALNGPDPQLPDPLYSQFTHDQLFFMSFAEVWCRKRPNNEALYRQLMTDPHSPSRYRVFGTIQNFPAFRAAFNCPPGLAYDPVKHCSVWVPEVTP